jgi:type IV pilus assembly protein PilQ
MKTQILKKWGTEHPLRMGFQLLLGGFLLGATGVVALEHEEIVEEVQPTEEVTAPEAVEAPAAEAVEAPPAVAEAPIEVKYRDADLQSVMRTLAQKAGVNLIMGDEIKGQVTVELKGVSYERAMQLIAEDKGYAFIKEKEENIVKIKSKESLEAEPVEVAIVSLQYAKASEMKTVLDGMLTRQGRIAVDARSNSLVISEVPSNHSRLRPLIAQLDSQTPQVMVEAKFIDTRREPRKDLGINWTQTLVDHPVSSGPYSLSKNLDGGPWLWNPAATPLTAVLSPGAATITFSFLNRDSDTDVLANPRVVTTDNTKARISIAEQFPIPNFQFSEQTASLQVSGFDYKDIGIILNVTPHINKNDFITLDVQPEVSSVKDTILFGAAAAATIPVIDTRTAATTVLIKSGHTLAIGGLIREDIENSYTKVPVLGDIPVAGRAFRSKKLRKEKRNLLIFITPTIVSPEGQTGYEVQYEGAVDPDAEYVQDTGYFRRDNAKPHNIFTRKPAYK